jgi:hypothetical protein
MGFFGDVFNPITSVFHAKLFPGGPYPDAGQGDQALAAQKAAYQQAMGSYGNAINQISPYANASIFDPNGNLAGTYGTMYNNMSGLNADAARQQQQHLQANLSGRGLGDSNAATAGNLYLNMARQGQNANAYAGLGQEANSQKMAMNNLLASLYQNQGNLQANMGNQEAGLHQQLGQMSQQQSGLTDSFWQSLLGGALGGSFGWNPLGGGGGGGGISYPAGGSVQPSSSDTQWWMQGNQGPTPYMNPAFGQQMMALPGIFG